MQMKLTILLPLLSVFALESDVIGEAYSSSSNPSHAVTYGYADVSYYNLNSSSDWITPEIVSELVLPSNLPSAPETAEAIPTTTQYYDGSSKLKHSRIKCRLFVTERNCLNQVSCGWCDETNACIPGSEAGPLLPCDAKKFRYEVAQ